MRRIRSTERPNQKIRQKMTETGIFRWELADLLGVHENTVTNRLRHELPEDEQKAWIQLIDDWSKTH